ncbi:MAG TPA: YeeE/YedE thiosulfate transporter family protein [Micromonospora sp.]
MTDYWPWWAGAIGLALVTINYTITTDRPLGVSSVWDRVLHWRAERRVEKAEAEFADERALTEALAAATAAHFGTLAPPHPAGQPAPPASSGVAPAPGRTDTVSSSRPGPLASQAALLVSIFLGGLIAALTSGRFQIRFDMGDGFRELVTGNPIRMVAVLFVGGVMVGFGTLLAGGCSSGHGLSGCGRLRPVSLVATAVFFGTAVAVSFLLWKVI